MVPVSNSTPTGSANPTMPLAESPRDIKWAASPFRHHASRGDVVKRPARRFLDGGEAGNGGL